MIDGYFGEDDDAFLTTISKKDIYNNLTLENVERFLRSLGVEVQVHSDFLICPTICHNPIEGESLATLSKELKISKIGRAHV